MRTTNIRFTGLASGLDTESMVQAMVMPYKMKVDSASQQQKLLELKKDAWKEMNTKLLNFQTKILNPMRLESTFNKTNISVSNSNLIELDKNISLPEGNHTIQVESIATGATVHSQSLKDVHGQAIDIDKTTTTLGDLGISTGNINVNGKSIAIQQDMTIEQFEQKMSEELKDLGINFKFDANHNTFIVSTKTTGANQKIEISADDSNVLKNLGLMTNATDGGKDIVSYQGQDAKVVYNGGVVITSSTNNIEINGIKFTVKGASQEVITISAARDTEAIVDFAKSFVNEYNALIEEMHKLSGAPRNKDYLPLTSEQKKEMTEDEIKLWEEKVNNSLLSNDPVLKELTSSMRNILGQTVSGNTFESLSAIGITTGKDWREKGKLYIDEDKLRKAINEDADAVVQLIAGEGDPKALYEKERALEEKKYQEDPIKNPVPRAAWDTLDNRDKQNYIDSTADKRLGLGDRLYNTMNEKMKSSSLKSANSFYNDKVLQEQIDTYNKKLTKLEEQMARMEDLYYKKFTAMEKALSQLNNQSSWLGSQLGGM